MAILNQHGVPYEDVDALDNSGLNVKLSFAESAASIGSFAHPFDDKALLAAARDVRNYAEPHAATHAPTLSGVLSNNQSADKFPGLSTQFKASLAYAFFVEAHVGIPADRESSLYTARTLTSETYGEIDPTNNLGSTMAYAAVMLRSANSVVLQESRAHFKPEERINLFGKTFGTDQALELALKGYSYVPQVFEELDAVPGIREVTNHMIHMQQPEFSEGEFMASLKELLGDTNLRDTGPLAETFQMVATGEHLFLITESHLGAAKCHALRGDKAQVDAELDKIDKVRAQYPRFTSPLLDDVYAQLRRMQKGAPFVPQSPLDLYKALSISPSAPIAVSASAASKKPDLSATLAAIFKRVPLFRKVA